MYYKNESLIYLYEYEGWFVATNSIDHLKGLLYNRSGQELDESKVKVLGNNVTCILKECETYDEAVGREQKEFFYLEMVDPTSGELKNPRELVGYADNFVRLEMVQEVEMAICLSTKNDAELFLKYIKKTNGGANAVIQKGLK